MTPPQSTIADAVAKLASKVPSKTVEVLAALIEGCELASTVRSSLPHHISHPYYRQVATSFVDMWSESGVCSPEAIALALRTAALVEKSHRAKQSVELVWTGPDAEVVPFRRTEQAILQVIESAQKHVTLVAYAVYKIPFIRDSLVKAARRGVKIRVILETPDKVQGVNEYNTLKALGDDVAECSTFYFWPKEQRKANASGKHGILHIKCVVADRRWLFLSSANLTEYAFSINMELGLLITGGSLPQQVEENFDRLIVQSILQEI